MAKALVKETEEQLPATILEQMEGDAGKGISEAQEDNLVPLIYALQKGSPQVNKRDDAYIEGAEAGDIWLRNASQEIVKGQEGITFQPCYFFKDWVEWIPRDAGGGFVGRHVVPPPEAKKQVNPKNPQAAIYVMPNGNELIETRSHVGFVLTPDGPLPYVVPFKSTGHVVSRAWMVLMNAKRTPQGKKAPPWAFLYKLSTKFRKNEFGDWFVLDAKDAGQIKKVEDYTRGKALYEAFASGAKQAEAEVVQESKQEAF